MVLGKTFKNPPPPQNMTQSRVFIFIKIVKQVKAKLEGQATAMMGVTLLNLGTLLTKYWIVFIMIRRASSS